MKDIIRRLFDSVYIEVLRFAEIWWVYLIALLLCYVIGNAILSFVQ